eukprot:2083501-Pleurochrysis_carterae.AAC.7
MRSPAATRLRHNSKGTSTLSNPSQQRKNFCLQLDYARSSDSSRTLTTASLQTTVPWTASMFATGCASRKASL